jgi:NADH dehydrogenase
MIGTIGRAAAVGRVGPLHLVGSPAWLAWLLVHIVSLIGFRNRLQVLVGWTWSYLAWDRGVRIITHNRPPVIGHDGLMERTRPAVGDQA